MSNTFTPDNDKENLFQTKTGIQEKGVCSLVHTLTTLSMSSCGNLGSSGVGWYFCSRARNCREFSLKHVEDNVARSSAEYFGA